MEELVQHLQDVGVLKTPVLIEAFLRIDRRDFVLPEYHNLTYEDHPLPIGFGQTISQPYTVAFMLELLQAQKGEKILDIGSGSGWTTALLAQIVGSKGRVVGIELQPSLTYLGQENLAKYDFPWAKIYQAKKGTLGFSKGAPFDKILVSASGKEIPQKLLSQLKEDGVMVLPVEDTVVRIQKKPGREPHVQRFLGFVFVPLV